jgi:hypothetical protein
MIGTDGCFSMTATLVSIFGKWVPVPCREKPSGMAKRVRDTT